MLTIRPYLLTPNVPDSDGQICRLVIPKGAKLLSVVVVQPNFDDYPTAYFGVGTDTGKEQNEDVLFRLHKDGEEIRKQESPRYLGTHPCTGGRRVWHVSQLGSDYVRRTKDAGNAGAPGRGQPMQDMDTSSATESEDWEKALELCGEVIDLCEEISEIDNAWDFVNSVREKVDSISSTISEYESVTENQLSALENMRDGCERWLR